jgi:aspartate aminotransferase-like enzyme
LRNAAKQAQLLSCPARNYSAQTQEVIMPALLPHPDADGLLEYSVVYTDRSLNHMSVRFGSVMRDISRIIKGVYNASALAIVPGSGTFGMEAVARQFANQERCLVVRNGWFSFRWSQILEMGRITDDTTVLKARRASPGHQAAFSPPPLEEVVSAIRLRRPGVVFAPHVETSSGIILPDEYVRAVGAAVREVGGLLVLDCIASGTIWMDMVANNIDVLISAPQKGWSASPCCGLVALGERAQERIGRTKSTSFACDLAKWLQIMGSYEKGGFSYHATLPTDSLAILRDVMLETERFGFAKAKAEAASLGREVRLMLASSGFRSVAAEGFAAPGVVVSYTSDAEIQAGRAFAKLGLQIAAGVPLQCDEGEDFRTFRIGLFGLDKLTDRGRTLAALASAVDAIKPLNETSRA